MLGESLIDPVTLLVVALVFLGYGVVSGRLATLPVTAPLVFTAAGLALGPAALGWLGIDLGHGVLHAVAELALVLVLFADAARIDFAALRRDQDFALRLLAIGLPAVIAAGTLVGALVLPGWPLWTVALLAAVLAPTDAALGQAVMTERAVPIRIRQTLNVESGLNDGLVLPAVLLFACLAPATHEPGPVGRWLALFAEQLGYGILVGLALGAAAAWLLRRASTAGWVEARFRGLATFGVAVAIYATAQAIGGNGFIAAFVGGGAFGWQARDQRRPVVEFAESEGQLLALLTFLALGAQVLPAAIAAASATDWLYALLSLTVVRLAGVGVAAAGLGLRWPTVVFVAWFGPRGLASLLFALLVVGPLAVPHGAALMDVATLTVGLSILLHGLTAAPLALAYGRLCRRVAAPAEHRPVAAQPRRLLRPWGRWLGGAR